MICILKLHFLGFFWKHLRALHALEDLEPLLEFPIHLSVRKSRENYRQIYVKSKASLWRNLSTGTPPKLFRTILCFVPLIIIYNCIFFRTAVFSDGNYSTLDSHTNTALPTRQGLLLLCRNPCKTKQNCQECWTFQERLSRAFEASTEGLAQWRLWREVAGKGASQIETEML